MVALAEPIGLGAITELVEESLLARLEADEHVQALFDDRRTELRLAHPLGRASEEPGGEQREPGPASYNPSGWTRGEIVNVEGLGDDSMRRIPPLVGRGHRGGPGAL